MARPKNDFNKTNAVDETVIAISNAVKNSSKKGNSLLQRLKKASGSEYVTVLGDDEYPIKEWISTRNYMLNALISGDPYKGIPTGRSVQLAGQKGTGKTMVAISLLNEAADMGYTGCIFDSEFANNDKSDMQAKGVDVDNTLWSGVETIEDLKFQTINMLDEIDREERTFMMVDSLGNLSTRKETEDSKTGSEKRDMTRPSALKSYFRTVTMKAGYKNVPLVVINHVYADTSSFIPQDVVAGGGGPAFGSSITLLFSKSQLKDGDEVVGAIIKVKSEKNRFAKEKSTIRFTIDFNKGGIQKYSGLLEFAVDEGILVPDSKIPKSGDVSKVKKFIYKGEELTKKQITPEFWEKALQDGLADVLRAKFKYQTVADELGLVTDDEEEIDD